MLIELAAAFPPSFAEEYARSLIEDERPVWSEVPDAAREVLQCYVWRELISVAQDAGETHVLMTADVPLWFWLCQSATLSLAESMRKHAGTVGMIDADQTY